MVEPELFQIIMNVCGWLDGVWRTFRTTSGHDNRGIMAAKLFHANITNVTSNFGQYSRYHSFERLFLIATWFIFQFPQFCLGRQLIA